jgi:hypothetical protein
MNRSFPGPSPLIHCCGALILITCWSSLAVAQQTGGVPAEVKTATNIADHKEALQTFINTQVQKLMSDDNLQVSQGRDALISEVNPVGNTNPSPTYLDAYADILNTALMPALKPDQPMLTRLNAAIATARIAERTESQRLLPVVLAILADKEGPVVLWGLKASRWILPTVMRNPVLQQSQRLLPAIVPAAKAHAQGPLSGAIVREAYDVVSLDVIDPARGKRVTDPMIAQVIDDMHGLMALRIEQYRKSIPAEPSAELRPTLFLVNGRVWGLHKPEQQVRSVQLMSDLLSLGAQHAASGETSSARDQLPVMVQRTGSALAVIPEVGKSPAAAAALKLVMEVGATTPGLEIKKRVEPVYAALKEIEKFKALTPPPVLGADAAAAAAPDTPASGPTTLPGTRGQGATTAPAANPGGGAPADPAGAPPAPGAGRRGPAAAPAPSNAPQPAPDAPRGTPNPPRPAPSPTPPARAPGR